MQPFPSITHVAVTVSDLDVSVPWYDALFGAEAVLDEDTGPFRHVVYALGDTLFGLHEFPDPVEDKFDERRPGLDHVAFGVPSRDDLLRAIEALDRHGVPHGEITDLAPFGISILAFRDPDNIQLELTAPYQA